MKTFVAYRSNQETTIETTTGDVLAKIYNDDDCPEYADLITIFVNYLERLKEQGVHFGNITFVTDQSGANLHVRADQGNQRLNKWRN